ncbi:hypothetical protein [Zavarzinella formosa]|uniref:hypothetical protein n=1 Tax=Zavarzinella formosa TaxID=360055 RepID=UPI00037BFD7B|nr:hypothetical protein [Zavarzinella formosa]
MDESWLVRRVTVAEAEAAHMVSDDRLGPDPIPFGWAANEWRKLVDEMRPGDELWEYDSPAAEWERNMGSTGFVLLRRGAEGFIHLSAGTAVASVTCRMN